MSPVKRPARPVLGVGRRDLRVLASPTLHAYQFRRLWRLRQTNKDVMILLLNGVCCPFTIETRRRRTLPWLARLPPPPSFRLWAFKPPSTLIQHN